MPDHKALAPLSLVVPFPPGQLLLELHAQVIVAGKAGPSTHICAFPGLSVALDWLLKAVDLLKFGRGGPGQRGQGGEEGRNTLLPDLEERWKVKYLESD